MAIGQVENKCIGTDVRVVKSRIMVQQSAAIPYRVSDAGRIEVLLVTSRSRHRWILPKGRVPLDMRPQFSAAREALEEGGVIGVASRVPVADYQQEKVQRDGSTSTVYVRAYAVAVSSVLNVWPEMHLRKRCWMPLKQAIRKVDDRRVRRVLKAFKEQRHCSSV